MQTGEARPLVLEKGRDDYQILRKYLMQARILSGAFNRGEKYHRSMYRWLTYPLVITSAVSTVLSGFQLQEYIVMSLSFITLILVGFNATINPSNKMNTSHNSAIEFDEIAGSLELYINENGRTSEEIKAYASHVNDILNIWKANSPPVKDSFIKLAQIDNAPRLRSKSHKKNSRTVASIEPRNSIPHAHPL